VDPPTAANLYEVESLTHHLVRPRFQDHRTHDYLKAESALASSLEGPRYLLRSGRTPAHLPAGAQGRHSACTRADVFGSAKSPAPCLERRRYLSDLPGSAGHRRIRFYRARLSGYRTLEGSEGDAERTEQLRWQNFNRTAFVTGMAKGGARSRREPMLEEPR